MADLVVSGGWRRVAAMIIDGIITGIIGFILQLVVPLPKFQYLIGQIVMLVYFIGLEATNQSSIGKMALGIYVANANGTKMTIDQIVLRYIIWVLPVIPLVVFSLVSNYGDIAVQLKSIQDPKLMMQYMQQPEVMATFKQMSMVSGLAGLLGLVLYFLPMFFTKQKTGLHDMVAKSRVFKKA